MSNLIVYTGSWRQFNNNKNCRPVKGKTDKRHWSTDVSTKTIVSIDSVKGRWLNQQQSFFGFVPFRYKRPILTRRATNDFFGKFWLSTNVNGGSKLALANHGGARGVRRINSKLILINKVGSSSFLYYVDEWKLICKISDELLPSG